VNKSLLSTWKHSCTRSAHNRSCNIILIGAVQTGIIEIRFDDARLQVIEHDALRRSPKVLEHPGMRRGKALLVLTEDELDVLMAAVGKGPDEGVQNPPALNQPVVPKSDPTIVDLDLCSWFDFDAAGGGPAAERDLMGEGKTLERAVADPSPEAVAFQENLEGVFGRQTEIPVVDQAFEFFPVLLEDGLSLWRSAAATVDVAKEA
jgi:hypothetical protein